ETTKFFYVANTLSDPTMLDSLQGCAITQILCYAHVAVEWHVFRHVAEMRSCLERLSKNIESRDGSATRGGRHEAGQNAHGGGFARTVGSQKSHDFTPANLEIQIPDGRLTSVTFRQIFDLNH